MRRRRIATVLAIVVVATATTAFLTIPGSRSGLAGLSLDSLFWLRQQVFGPRHRAAESPVALVVIDEATYRTEPFRTTPAALWTPFLARILDGILQADPAAVGFDLILPTTAQAYVPGFDRDFLRVLHAGGTAGKLVLGKLQGEGLPLLPFAGQIIAVGGDGNVRSTNEPEDADGIIRRFAYTFPRPDGSREPTFALELAARARNLPADSLATRDILELPKADAPDEALLDFDGGQPFPTYSLTGVYGCVIAGGDERFRSLFAGKVVLIGTFLDVEDRKLTSRRFINGPEIVSDQACAPPQRSAAADAPGDPGEPRTAVTVRPVDRTAAQFFRATLPGAFIHATAIQNILQREHLRTLSAQGRAAAIFILAALVAAVAFSAGFGGMAGGLAATVGCLVVAGTLGFQAGLVLPLIEMLIAVACSSLLMLSYRFAVADREKRRIRAMFGLYLSPHLVDGLVRANRMPVLGGERRSITFFFTDIAGFTTLSEKLDPALLASVLNVYFDRICDIVMAEGGLVVEFMGDGVLAMFGAPTEQNDHAARALSCARLVDDFAEQFRAVKRGSGIALGATRIGVHTGSAVVGNFGSTRRLKYTAMGDAVNTASRIEGLNKYFGTRMCTSQEVCQAAADRDVRLLGQVQVKGRTGLIDIYEVLPIGLVDSAHMQAYGAAIDALATGDPSAEARFSALAESGVGDSVVAFHLARLRAGEQSAVIVMTEK